MSLPIDSRSQAMPVASNAPAAGLRAAAAFEASKAFRPTSAEIDRATISDAALTKSSMPAGGWKDKLVFDAHAHPQEGDKWLAGYTSVTQDGPVLDISDPPAIKLSSTGEVWTPESQKKYETASQLVMQARADLYTSEKSKGTPPAEIMEKIFSYNDALPQWYKDGMNWR